MIRSNSHACHTAMFGVAALLLPLPTSAQTPAILGDSAHGAMYELSLERGDPAGKYVWDWRMARYLVEHLQPPAGSGPLQPGR